MMAIAYGVIIAGSFVVGVFVALILVRHRAHWLYRVGLLEEE
jgi:hypothetical protein